MSGARQLLHTYLHQRSEMGESPVVLPASAEASPPRPVAGAPEMPAPRNAERKRPARRRSEPGWRASAPPIPPPGITIAPPSADLFSDDEMAGQSVSGLAELISTCTRCPLCQGRTHAVPGQGPEDARLVAVGEGPGATEDETGLPFVGRAGELLTEILAAIDFPREKVFICNVVKCRPPNNRRPQPDEIQECVPYLHRQIDVIQPSVILAMGGTAAETLLNTKQALGALRSRVHSFRGIPLVVTYHPAALLRNPHWKKPTWDDVRIARRLLAGER